MLTDSARASFRLQGEQIDGSFVLGEQTDFIEGKWTNALVGAAPLRAFNSKGEDKAACSCGLFISSVVAWIGAEMEFALSEAIASGDAFEHRPSECGHCVQNFLADLDLRDLPGEAAGSESGADDTLPPADLRFYPAALVVPCGRLPGHAAVAAELGNMAIPNRRIPRRLRPDHCVLWRRYNHIQGLPIPFPQQIPCGRPIIGAVRQKARDRGIELIQEPVSGLLLSSRRSCPISFSRRFFSAS